MIIREAGNEEYNLTISKVDESVIVTMVQEIGPWDFNGVPLVDHYNTDSFHVTDLEKANRVFDDLVTDLNLREIVAK